MCPNCKTEYTCPCDSCKKNFPDRKHWIVANEEDHTWSESCPTCGLTKDVHEWEAIFWQQYKQNQQLTKLN